MSTQQFKRRTFALKLPKKSMTSAIRFPTLGYMLKAKIAPWRAKASGTRSKVLGELSFIDHGEVSINPQSKLQFLLLSGGQTSLTSACVQNGQILRRFYIFFNYLETYYYRSVESATLQAPLNIKWDLDQHHLRSEKKKTENRKRTPRRLVLDRKKPIS